MRQQYNKQVARELYDELKDRVQHIPDTIENAPDDGPVIDLIAASLGAALSALKNGPPKED